MKITQKITALLLISAIIVSAFSFSAMGAAPVKGSDVAAYARQFEGCGYQYAAKGPDKFDCSGLVYYVLRNFGITFGNSTSEYNTPEKAKAFGNVISGMSDAKAGDIVAWGSHTGVYLGEGKCISSMNSRKGVTIIDVERFVDKHGITNPYHFFIRPYEYADETAEDTPDAPTETPGTGGETPETPETPSEGAPSEGGSTVFELFLVLIIRIIETFVRQLLASPATAVANFFAA